MRSGGEENEHPVQVGRHHDCTRRLDCYGIDLRHGVFSPQRLCYQPFGGESERSQAIAIHIDGHLKGLARTTATLATMPALKGSVLASNAAYDSLDPLEREAEIDRLDKLWRAAIDAEDPFLEEFLHNPTADLLREQQNIVDDLFGEIFLTNRYGAVIAATGQLTNFAQGDEYWWQAAVHGGEGRVFLMTGATT